VLHLPLFLVLAWLAGGNLHIPHCIRYVSLVPTPCLDFEASWNSTKNEEHHYLGTRRSAKLGVLVVVSDVQAQV
jgi:hypothetical protein